MIAVPQFWFFRNGPIIASLVMLLVSCASFSEETFVGYKPFSFAAYEAAYDRYDLKAKRYRPKHSSHRTYVLKAIDMEGPYGGLVLQRYTRTPPFRLTRTPFVGQPNGRIELGRSGLTYMYGLFPDKAGLYPEKKKTTDASKSADEIIPPMLDKGAVLAKEFVFPVFPRREEPLKSGDEWTVTVPPLIINGGHLLSLRNANSTLRQKWEDTVQVGEYKCAEIRFSMEEHWQPPESDDELIGRVRGVSYFSIHTGVPVVTIVEWEVQKKTLEGMEIKERERSSISLIAVSGYEGEVLRNMPKVDMAQIWPLIPFNPPDFFLQNPEYVKQVFR